MKRSLELSRDGEFLRGEIIFNAENIGLAAHLAILDVALPATGGFVD
jgi:hypothetical protein